MTKQVTSSKLNQLSPTQAVHSLKQLDYSLIMMILAIKALIITFGVLSYQVLKDQQIASFQEGIAIWNRWDAPHYIDIASQGYQATGESRFFLVFYPLFPLLIRLFLLIGGSYVASAFVVSGLAAIATGILLQKLVQLDYSKRFARSTVWFLFIFPTSYFLHIGYTESLFLALTLGCLLAARHQRWRLAGILGALASLTRVSGIILMPTLLVEVIQQYRLTRFFNRQWLWISAIPLGFGIYLICNLYVTGNPFAFLALEHEYWFKVLAFPWVGIQAKLTLMQTYSPFKYQMVGVQELFFIALGLVCIIWSWLKLRPAYSTWTTLNWLLFISTSHILSVPRYSLVLFPLYILFAELAKNQLLYTVITVWSLLFLALFTSLFVQNLWAF